MTMHPPLKELMTMHEIAGLRADLACCREETVMEIVGVLRAWDFEDAADFVAAQFKEVHKP